MLWFAFGFRIGIALRLALALALVLAVALALFNVIGIGIVALGAAIVTWLFAFRAQHCNIFLHHPTPIVRQRQLESPIYSSLL